MEKSLRGAGSSRCKNRFTLKEDTLLTPLMAQHIKKKKGADPFTEHFKSSGYARDISQTDRVARSQQ